MIGRKGQDMTIQAECQPGGPPTVLFQAGSVPDME
jgi:hypothetical protein